MTNKDFYKELKRYKKELKKKNKKLLLEKAIELIHKPSINNDAVDYTLTKDEMEKFIKILREEFKEVLREPIICNLDEYLDMEISSYYDWHEMDDEDLESEDELSSRFEKKYYDDINKVNDNIINYINENIVNLETVHFSDYISLLLNSDDVLDCQWFIEEVISSVKPNSSDIKFDFWTYESHYVDLRKTYTLSVLLSNALIDAIWRFAKEEDSEKWLLYLETLESTIDDMMQFTDEESFPSEYTIKFVPAVLTAAAKVDNNTSSNITSSIYDYMMYFKDLESSYKKYVSHMDIASRDQLTLDDYFNIITIIAGEEHRIINNI